MTRFGLRNQVPFPCKIWSSRRTRASTATCVDTNSSAGRENAILLHKVFFLHVPKARGATKLESRTWDRLTKQFPLACVTLRCAKFQDNTDHIFAKQIAKRDVALSVDSEHLLLLWCKILAHKKFVERPHVKKKMKRQTTLAFGQCHSHRKSRLLLTTGHQNVSTPQGY